jgi:hypothetical protein
MDELAGEGPAAYLASRNRLEALQAAIESGFSGIRIQGARAPEQLLHRASATRAHL